jgi:hypothetical protein
MRAGVLECTFEQFSGILERTSTQETEKKEGVLSNRDLCCPEYGSMIAKPVEPLVEHPIHNVYRWAGGVDAFCSEIWYVTA